ncbi:trigger factor [Hyphomicrobium sulfonivorans]|uniref:Trigger factor n=1 Tax=Hyphomicrobium sulfonivorans TaxID=121290 RepID=A0A109BP19_HYPSL|nr:trigger factor [Hyphomicrobium sulfonivorans]KWT72338.1 Cell division trigger factor [Hyphomicrobium sulfonivorans]MBI1650784.1 trigger factor [Hyphomicrobium sulfonivorans]NSL71859.1 trigger factor [Hyphomicrobium sulfonivorans]
MQITETSSEGLKRTLQVVVPAGEITKRFDDRLEQMKDRVQLKGFRKGKVPVAHLKQMYGRSVMAEVVQEAVRDSSNQALADKKMRPAMQPDLKLPEDEAEIERVLSGQADLSYSMSFEVLPPIPLTNFEDLKLEKFVADVDEESIDKAVSELVDRSVTFTTEEGRVSSTGDQVTADFVGKIDGEAFDGGTTEDAVIVLGRGNFIPGFEEGLTGVKAGDEKDITATFPADYPVAELAGKEAIFSVKVKEIGAPVRPEVDEEFAKSLGAESLDQLKEYLRERIGNEYAGVSRQKLKRDLLDQLEERHDFELPPSLVEAEFNGIWGQLEENLKRSGKTLADEGKTEEEARAEYRKLAERRVRLGLVIGEIAEKNELKITQDEMRRALMEQARRFPGQEKQVYEYYEKTPGALAELRAPIFEEKVVDFIVDKAKPIERKIPRQELFAKLDELDS